ncbi:MAG TPA: hypothetical protein VKB80_27440 [Kofleriaceae bacterium]|nr:hypothetical protein [Kofleriaceae bacterium]
MDTPFSAVHFGPWQALVRRLDAAVSADSALAAPRDVLTRPVELLLVLAADVPAALGDDVLRADRLRSLLYLTIPFSSVVDQAERVLHPPGNNGNGESWPPSALPPIRPYEPGVIDMGAMPILAIAAARVGPPEIVPLFTRALHGLALAASAAEVLGRLDPEMPDGDALEVVVHTLHLLESLGSALRTPYLRTFAFDPIERGRWRCLAELLGPDRLQGLLAGAAWDGAHTREIRRVVPRRALPAAQVTLLGRFDFLGGGAVPADVQVVFAAPGGAVVPARVVGAAAGSGEADDQIAVEAPDGAEPEGWIGFSVDGDIAASNSFRAQLRERIAAAYADDDCLVSTRVRGELVRPLDRPDPGRPGQLVAMPPRGAFNRFTGGAPLLTAATLEPEVAAPGAALTLGWDSTGADEVVRLPAGAVLPPSGSLALTAPAAEGPFAVELQPVALVGKERLTGASVRVTATVVAPVRIRSIELAQDGRPGPFLAGRALAVDVLLDPPTSRASGRLRTDPTCGDGPLAPAPASLARGSLRFDVPGPCVVDGLTLTAELVDPLGKVLDQRVAGPLQLAALRDVTIALFRPVALAPQPTSVGADEARARIADACARRGLSAAVVELPWEGDALAVIEEAVRRSEDPALPRLLGALARRAMVTPGLEHALWLALLPGDDEVAAWAPSAASRAVAVAAGSGLGLVLDGALPLPAPPVEPPIFLASVSSTAATAAAAAAAPRAADTRPAVLRLVASARGVEIGEHEVALERRLPGRGGAVPSAWTAVALDRAGDEIARHPIHLVHEQLPGYIEALLPAASDMVALELRSGRRIGLRVERPDGDLHLTDPRLAPGPRAELTWRADHSSGLNPRITLAAAAGGVVTPVAELDVCGGRDLVWLDRLGPLDRLVLQASDGWTRIEVDIDGELPGHQRVALRRLADGRWFAEAPATWTLSWTLDGRRLDERGPLLALPAGATGLLAVEARGPGGELGIDARPVAEGRA